MGRYCRPCQAVAPVYDRSAHAHPDVVHAKVDTQAEFELSATLGIRSVPTIMAFRDGVLANVPVEFRHRNLLLGRSTRWSDLFGVGDDDDLTDEGVFHRRVEEKVGDVCTRG